MKDKYLLEGRKDKYLLGKKVTEGGREKKERTNCCRKEGRKGGMGERTKDKLLARRKYA